VDLDARPGHSNLLDQQAHESLTLLEVESVDALPDAAGERFDPASQPVVDRELLALPHQRLPLLFELSMPVDHLSMTRLELRELDGLHLVEVRNPSSLGVGLLETTLQPLQLSAQELVVGPPCAGTERCLSFPQGVWLEQGLAQLFPDQRIQLLGPG
jgi:hypothetical protein